jgi:DNA invertase Pin-like site-specific DNA recombinase
MAVKAKTLGVYVRVSDVGGRDGERFISPRVQQEQAERYARSRGFEIGRTFEDLDVSGATPLEARPALSEALALIEEGSLGGLVVATQDRAARDLSLLRELRARVREYGGMLLAADNPSLEEEDVEGLAALPTDIRALVDEAYRGEARKRWRASRKDAIARGVHVGQTPPGYDRGEDGRLTPNKIAPAIGAAFEKRVQGGSWTQIAAFGDEHFPRPNGKKWSRSGIVKLISNRTYLGEIRSGEFVNLSAHEHLVDEELFLAANRSRPCHPRTGKLSSQAMLAGLMRCAGCGRKMQIGRQWSSGKASERATYYCRAHSSDGRCPAPAWARVDTVDMYVETRLREHFDGQGPVADSIRAATKVEGREAVVAQAQEILSKVLTNTRMITALGEDEYTEMIESAKRDLEIAKVELAEVKTAAEMISGLDGNLLSSWDALEIADKRRVVSTLLDRVVLRKLERGEGGVHPFFIQMVWRDNTVVTQSPSGGFYDPEPEAVEAA